MVDWEQKILQNGDTNVYGQVKQWLLLQLFGSYLELLHEKGGRGGAGVGGVEMVEVGWGVAIRGGWRGGGWQREAVLLNRVQSRGEVSSRAPLSHYKHCQITFLKVYISIVFN